MPVIMFVVFYLLGCIVHYVMFRIEVRRHYKWDNDHMINGICISTFSWIGVVGLGVKILVRGY